MTKRLWAVVSALVTVTVLDATTTGQDWPRAVSLFNQKQYREAIREFHAVLRANPEYWQAWYYIGASHFHLRGYEDAIDSFERYTKAPRASEKEQSAGNYFIGFSYYQLKQYDKAIPSFAKYVLLAEKTREKVDPSAQAALGRCYIFAERYNDAIGPLRSAAAEMKTNANNHYYIGFAYHKLNQEDQAIGSLNQALAIDPKDADTLALLGDIYLLRSRQTPATGKQAVAIAEKLLAVRDDERSWGLLGQAYLADKQFAKAAPHLAKYARAHLDSGPAWFNYGLALSRSEQWKPAAEALEQAIKLAPTNAAALNELGYVYEADKQFAKALSTYERAYEASGRRDQSIRESIDRVKQVATKPL